MNQHSENFPHSNAGTHQCVRDHVEFAAALSTHPSALAVTSEDWGIYNWLKDYRRGWWGV